MGRYLILRFLVIILRLLALSVTFVTLLLFTLTVTDSNQRIVVDPFLQTVFTVTLCLPTFTGILLGIGLLVSAETIIVCIDIEENTRFLRRRAVKRESASIPELSDKPSIWDAP